MPQNYSGVTTNMLPDIDAKVSHCLLFTPDAMGKHLQSLNGEYFADVKKVAPIEIEVQSVYPSLTPVCFASMFTGLSPDQHGIKRYEKPVLNCMTLFDILVGANVESAIVAVRNSSIDTIFRGRRISYFSEVDDLKVEKRVIELLRGNKFRVIVAYQQAYDDNLHASEPFSDKALNAAESHKNSFTRIAEAVATYWVDHDRLIAFLPDHGAHVDQASGKGTHGSALPSDMDILHFFGHYRSRTINLSTQV
jgi:hypothetical protein